MSASSKPVFFDSSGWRSSLLSAVKASSYGLVSFLLTFLLISIIVAPTLPALKLSNDDREIQPAVGVFERAEAAEPRIQLARERLAPAVGSSTTAGKRYAFFVNWDDNSFSSLKRHHQDLDVLMPLWLHLDGSSGDFTHDDPIRERNVLDWLYGHSATSSGEASVSDHWPVDLSWLHGKAPELSVMPVIDNYNARDDRWEGTAADHLLSSNAARAELVHRLIAYVQAQSLAGLVLDFEETSIGQQANFSAFANDLARQLHELGKQLLIAVPADDDDLNISQLAATQADALIVLAYDEHVDEPGPLAGQGWFESVLDHAFANVDDFRIHRGDRLVCL